MIKIVSENGNLKVDGELKLGYIGTFSGKKLELMSTTIEDYRNYGIVKDNMSADASDEAIIEYLNQYFNDFIEKINKNISKINDQFLFNVFNDMDGCAKEFWTNEKLFISSKMPNELSYQDIYSAYSKIGTNENCDEKKLRKLFPMFNFENFIDSIVPEYATLMENGHICFQCSDSLGNLILCAAYDEIDENLNFIDWHNF